MPLNRLSAKEPSYVASSDAIPMLERLEFEPRFRRAFVQVFGKTVIVRSIALGADYARKHKLTAITLDGKHVHLIHELLPLAISASFYRCANLTRRNACCL